MRASASLTRCFSLEISSNVAMLYLRDRVSVDTVLINLLGVYHYDAHSATAERADLFGSAKGRRENVQRSSLKTRCPKTPRRPSGTRGGLGQVQPALMALRPLSACSLSAPFLTGAVVRT